MASSATAIAKRAAQLMGISSGLIVDIVSSPSGYEEIELSAAFAAIRDAELRKHRWNFSKRRLTLGAETIRTITGITAANPPVVTSVAHGFANGDVVYIDHVQGMTEVNNKSYTVANKTTDTFELSGVIVSGYTAYASGGKLYGYVPKPFSYAYVLPADYLQMIQVDGVYDFDIDDKYLTCDVGDTIAVEYVSRVTDTTKFDPLFDEALAAALAVEFCELFSQSNSKKADLNQTYEEKIRWARRTNAIERGPSTRKVPAEWVEVRR